MMPKMKRHWSYPFYFKRNDGAVEDGGSIAYIFNELEERIRKKSTRWRKPIDAKQRLAICLR